jgi:hypothetical protein
MRCVGRFYTIAKNDIFLVEKAVKQFFIYFSMTGGASSYTKTLIAGTTLGIKKTVMSWF